MNKKIVSAAMAVMMTFSVFTQSLSVSAKSVSLSTTTKKTAVKAVAYSTIKTSTNLLSMTEAKLVDVSFNIGDVKSLSDLKWTFGGKSLTTSLRQWNIKDHSFTGVPVISFAKKPYISGNTVKATIKFDSFYAKGDWSLYNDYNDVKGYYEARKLMLDIIGNYDLAVTNTKTHKTAKVQMKLNIYDGFHRYTEFKSSIENLIKGAKKDRYITYESIGKSAQGRDMYFVIVAKDKTSVDNYLATVPERLKNPEEFQKKLQDKTIGDYKVAVWFNNIHPDENPGPDAMFKLIQTYTTQDTVKFNSKDKTTGKVTAQTINVKKALDNMIFVFNLTENPDGRFNDVRTNGNGFDLNRDNGYQTQPETQALAKALTKWSPISLLDFHGFVSDFLIEPCTPPHDPNYEYDLLYDTMFAEATAMGEAGLGNSSYKGYIIPAKDYGSGWDDATMAYTATYAMMHGVLGHTVEIPELGENSVNALVGTGYGATNYIMKNKDKLFANQLEIFRRQVANEDNKAVDQYLVNGKGEVIGRNRGTNENFFPNYYVLPVDSKMSKNPLETYHGIEYLIRNGVDVYKSTQEVKIGDTTYPAGSYVVPMAQAERGLANDALYNGEDYSDWDAMYAEVVMNLPEMRGFSRYEIRTPNVFDGKIEKVTSVEIPKTIVTNTNSEYYVIKNENNDAVKAVNKLLSSGQSVASITEKAGDNNIGDFVVTKAGLDMVKDSYYLQVVDYNKDVKTKSLKNVKVAALGSPATAFTLKQLGFNIVTNAKNADIIVDDAGYANIVDIAAGKPYIGIGPAALDFAKQKDLVYGFDYGYTDFYHEGLTKGEFAEDNLITSGYDNSDMLYTASSAWISKVPARALVLARYGSSSDFYTAGWWPGHEKAQGQVYAMKYQAGKLDITLFAGTITNKAHTVNLFRLLSNSIYSAELDK